MAQSRKSPKRPPRNKPLGFKEKSYGAATIRWVYDRGNEEHPQLKIDHYAVYLSGKRVDSRLSLNSAKKLARSLNQTRTLPGMEN